MNGAEIQKKVSENLRIIEEAAAKGIFTLDERASKAVEENKYLRGICPHCFDETGHCRFCDQEAD